jgi:hypothetical protein
MNANQQRPEKPEGPRFPLMPDQALDRYGNAFTAAYVIDGEKQPGVQDFGDFALARFLAENKVIDLKIKWDRGF